eukprot:TRINITY_DN7520_c0_g1_i1.p1 TRINITY_DN7520_c0_g1~~TRINITY_DN7520_c0_g1_i1.p1  ORF type:complete len:169 (-),score=51.86 TRINITY_DN7520_c0_g1_i1:518-1024(-)
MLFMLSMFFVCFFDVLHRLVCFFFFFNDTATTEIYTLHIVGSVRCVQETGINAEYMGDDTQTSKQESCPFNQKHKVLKEYMLNHILNKCNDYQKQKDEYGICEYNVLHIYLKNDPQLHYQRCKDYKKAQEQNKQVDQKKFKEEMKLKDDIDNYFQTNKFKIEKKKQGS